MDDNKIQLNITPIQTKTLIFPGDNKIEISCVLKNETKFEIISGYIQYLLDEDNILNAYRLGEGWVFTRIIQDCTNIDTDAKNGYGVEAIEYIHNSGIYQKIKETLVDYDDFRQELDDAIGLVLKDKYSAKQVFGEITKFVDGFMNSDKLKDLVKQLDIQKKELSKIYPSIKIDDTVGQTLEDQVDPQIKLEMQAESDAGKFVEDVGEIEKKPRKKRVKKF